MRRDNRKRFRRLATNFGVLLLSVAVTASIGSTKVGHAADAPPAPSVTPSAVEPGDTITVTGSGCPQAGWDASLTWTVYVKVEPAGVMLHGPMIVEPTGATPHTPVAATQEGYRGRADADVAADPDGTWSAQLVVPATGPFAADPGEYEPFATCYATEGAEAGMVFYPAPAFTVTTPVVRESPPSPGIPGSPRFTG